MLFSKKILLKKIELYNKYKVIISNYIITNMIRIIRIYNIYTRSYSSNNNQDDIKKLYKLYYEQRKIIQENKTEILYLKNIIQINNDTAIGVIINLDQQIKDMKKIIESNNNDFNQFKQITLYHEDEIIKLIDFIKHMIRNKIK
jgi:hypothetical protein